MIHEIAQLIKIMLMCSNFPYESFTQMSPRKLKKYAFKWSKTIFKRAVSIFLLKGICLCADYE